MSVKSSQSTELAESTDESVFRRWASEIRRTDSGVVASQSAQIAGVVAVGTLIVGGLANSGTATAGVVSGFVCGLLLAVSVATIRYDHILSSVVGGVGVLVSGGFISGFVGMGLLTETGFGISVFGLPAVIVGFGVASFWIAGFGSGAVGRTLGLLLRVGTLFGVAAVLVGVVWADLQSMAAVVSPGLTELFAPTTETGSVAGFVVVCWLAVGGIWIAVTALPPSSAVPASFRQQYQSLTGSIVVNAVVGIGAGSIVVALLSVVSLQTGVATGIFESTVGRLAESSMVRTAFVRLWLAGMAAAMLIGIVRSVGAAAIVGSTQWSSSGIVIASGMFAIGVLGAGPLADTLVSLSQTPATIQMAVGIVGPTVVGLALSVASIGAIGLPLFIGVLLSGSGILPSATAGPRLVAGGLLLMAIGLATVGSSVWVVLGTVAAAVVAWDVALYGVGVHADLDTLTGHRDGQQIHAVAIVVIGGLSALGTGVFYWLIADVRVDHTGVVLAVVVATLVLVGVSLLLRRR